MGARRGRRRRLIVLWEVSGLREYVENPPGSHGMPPSSLAHAAMSSFTCHHRHPSEVDETSSQSGMTEINSRQTDRQTDGRRKGFHINSAE